MHFAYQGFTQDRDRRCFTFWSTRVNPVSVFSIEIDLPLLSRNRVPVQEVPMFCLQLLTEGLSCRAELSREIPQLPSRRSGFSSATNRARDKGRKGAEKTPSPTSSKTRQLAKSLFGNNFKGALKKCLLRNARPVLSQPYPFRTMRRRPRESMDFPTRGSGSS